MTAYDRVYFEKTALGLTGNSLTDTLKKPVYHSAPVVRALMIKLFLNPQTVLDVGCGRGALVLWLRRLGTEAYGVDISDWALENAPELIQKYLRKGDIAALPFKDCTFDLVTTFNLLEHINERKLPQAIRECQRAAERWVLHKIWGTAWFEQRYPVTDPTHVTVRRGSWWKGLFAELGFKPASKFLPKWEAGLFLLTN